MKTNLKIICAQWVIITKVYPTGHGVLG